MALLIYTHKINNRKSWILHHTLTSILGIDFTITQSKTEFKAHSGAKFTYGDMPLGEELFLMQHPFMDEEEITLKTLVLIRYEHYKVPFQVHSSAFSFDIFSASFYLLSRYEEYSDKDPDEHGRYRAENSMAYKAGFLHLPVIDRWAQQLLRMLKERFANLQHKIKQFTFIPTIDIDRPYYLKTEPAFRKILKTGKSFLKGHFQLLHQDPFDTYEYMKKLHDHHQLSPHFFFLMNNKHQYDVAPLINKNHTAYADLIKSVSAYALTGLHPSYAANNDFNMFLEEKKTIEDTLQKSITSSRQHYLKLNLPHTYHQLIAAGIQNDYTMGYASQTGFRASTCTSFKWYDLENKSVTNLSIHPFMVMDQTLKKYLKLTPEESIEKIKKLIKEVKNVNGTFISLWHNESLSDFGNWKGWRKVYEEMLK